MHWVIIYQVHFLVLRISRLDFSRLGIDKYHQKAARDQLFPPLSSNTEQGMLHGDEERKTREGELWVTEQLPHLPDEF